jgi:transposase
MKNIKEVFFMSKTVWYIALDWAQKNMAIAIAKNSEEPIVTDQPTSLKRLKDIIEDLDGEKIMTLEESSTAQWLYVELYELVNKLIVCDPYKNKLLSYGPKNDKIDALKLLQLLRGGFLKPVFHSTEIPIKLRKLASYYIDLIKETVQLKNQRSAIYLAQGFSRKEKQEQKIDGEDKFVLDLIEQRISLCEEQRQKYVELFQEKCKTVPLIKNIYSIPGFGEINAVKLAATVVNANRFPDKSAWLSYCGLVRLQKMSGGRSYGSRIPRHSRLVKSIFKSAALATMDNHFKDFYQSLIIKKNYPAFNARHALARRIAIITYGVMKSNQSYQAERIKNIEKDLLEKEVVLAK